MLELYYWEEMTAVEIAEVVECPVGTAKSRLRRAKEQLEAALVEIAESPELARSTMSNLAHWAAGLRDPKA